jgi:tetratricopeptide (TPR) repeat protein
VLERRKKISKKQMKEDKLVTTYYKAYNFFMEYQAKILIGAAVVALVVVAIVLLSNKRSSDNKNAAELLSKVIPLYEAGQFREAVDGIASSRVLGLKKIVSDYGSTENGETAKIYLANSYVMLGNLDLAYEEYNSYSGSNPLFKATALAGKAGCLEVKKDFEKAADLFKDAAKVSKGNSANSEYLLKAGIDFIKIRKKEEAKSVFETIKKDYKNTSAFYELDHYLVQVENL